MIISDDGVEFHYTLFTDMTGQFNKNVNQTAAESPWSNGMVKRHSALEHKNKYLIGIIIAWVVNGKNHFHNCYGYSPHQ